jgi:hypothetical protein
MWLEAKPFVIQPACSDISLAVLFQSAASARLGAVAPATSVGVSGVVHMRSACEEQALDARRLADDFGAAVEDRVDVRPLGGTFGLRHHGTLMLEECSRRDISDTCRDRDPVSRAHVVLERGCPKRRCVLQIASASPPKRGEATFEGELRGETQRWIPFSLPDTDAPEKRGCVYTDRGGRNPMNPIDPHGTWPRCASCGATQVTPPTRFDLSSPVNAAVTFRPRAGKSLFGLAVMESFGVDRARICLACGHVMLALSPGKLAELRGKIGGLDPL